MTRTETQEHNHRKDVKLQLFPLLETLTPGCALDLEQLSYVELVKIASAQLAAEALEAAKVDDLKKGKPAAQLDLPLTSGGTVAPDLGPVSVRA